MTNFFRSGHYRKNQNGTVSWVSGHSVSRFSNLTVNYRAIEYVRRSDLAIKREIPLIDIFQIKKVLPNAKCGHCQKLIFVHHVADGQFLAFEILSPPWPKHSCKSNEFFFEPLSELDFSKQTFQKNAEQWHRLTNPILHRSSSGQGLIKGWLRGESLVIDIEDSNVDLMKILGKKTIIHCLNISELKVSIFSYKPNFDEYKIYAGSIVRTSRKALLSLNSEDSQSLNFQDN